MPKHKEALRTLKNALGQLNAVIKMTEDERYCIDISTQVEATVALLKKAQREIITDHLNHCVMESINLGDSKAKIDEINNLLKKLI